MKKAAVEAAVVLGLDDGDTGGCILINFVLIREISADIFDFLNGIRDGGIIGDEEQTGFIRVMGRLQVEIIAEDGKGVACGEAGVDRAGQNFGENCFERGAAGGVVLPCDGGRHVIENIGIVGEWHGDSFSFLIRFGTIGRVCVARCLPRGGCSCKAAPRWGKRHHRRGINQALSCLAMLTR